MPETLIHRDYKLITLSSNSVVLMVKSDIVTTEVPVLSIIDGCLHRYPLPSELKFILDVDKKIHITERPEDESPEYNVMDYVQRLPLILDFAIMVSGHNRDNDGLRMRFNDHRTLAQRLRRNDPDDDDDETPAYYGGDEEEFCDRYRWDLLYLSPFGQITLSSGISQHSGISLDESGAIWLAD